MLYIIFALLIFGILIAVHEAGHFAAAKSLGVKVNEFAIGMGPAIFKKQRGETLYALRVFPVGGYCAMEGEDENSSDPRAFTCQPVWKRFIILFAGAFMNFLLGFLILLILSSQATAFYVPVISDFMDGFSLEGESGLMVGDRILKIDDEPIYIYSDLSVFFPRGNGSTFDIEIERGDEKLILNDFPLTLKEYTVDGVTESKYGIYFSTEPATVLAKLENAWFTSVDVVRLVKMGLIDLVSGRASVKDMSGPVGIVSFMSDAGEQAASVWDAIANISYIGAFIAVNLAVMNLLPLPALDGGRIFFMFVTAAIEKVRKKRLDPKYEGYVHAAGLALLLLLMVFVTFNDIVKLVV